jgi:hypothetical protein
MKTMLSRRHFALLLGLSVPALIAGCANAPSAAQIQADAKLISDGLTSVFKSLTAAGVNIPAATVAQIQTALTQIQAAATDINAAASPQASLVSNLTSAVSVLSTLATPFFPAATPIGLALQAALALVPGLLAMVGLSAPASAAASSMTPDQARLILRGAAVTKP